MSESLTGLNRKRSPKRSKLQREILLRIHLRDQLVSQETEPTDADPWSLDSYRVMKAHGAEWSTSLFAPQGGRMPDRIRARYRRAFRELVADGLVIAHREGGDRVTNAKLSDAGSALAEKLADQPPKEKPQ